MDDDQLSALLEQAAAWRDDDPDPRSRAELEALVAAAEGEGGGADGSLERARAELARPFRRHACSSAPPACAGRWARGRTG